MEDGLVRFGDRVTLHSRAADRTPTLFVTFANRDSMDAYRHLAARDIAAPAGTFYAYEPAKVLGVEAGLRVGLAPYNTDAEIDRLLDGLDAFLA
ncbi:MAG: aminotransferase class V-fold PLP-dependent enzyme [Micropruina sp.]